MKRLLRNKMFWTITIYIITTLISLGISALFVIALLKYIFS